MVKMNFICKILDLFRSSAVKFEFYMKVIYVDLLIQDFLIKFVLIPKHVHVCQMDIFQMYDKDKIAISYNTFCCFNGQDKNENAED